MMVKTIRLAWLASATMMAGVLGVTMPVHAQALKGATSQTVRPTGPGVEVDRIVAIVNNGVITERQLDRRMQMVKNRMQSQAGVQVPPDNDLRQQVLQQMIMSEIQMQQAEQDGIQITDAQVDQTLERLAQANGLPLPEFRARVEAQGVPWDTFRSDARDEMTLNELRRREVDSKITVSDGEVANYIASQRGVTTTPPDLHLAHLLVPVPANATDALVQAAQQKAAGLIKDARSGDNFARLARSNSAANDAKQGGDLGFKPQADLPPAYVEAVSRLAPGQVAPEPIRTADGFEVVRLEARRPAAHAQDKITQTHVAHILIRVEDGGNEGAALQKLQSVRQAIESGKGSFADFAKTTSQDGSAGNGGDLGWVNPGQTVPEFERVMNTLQPGQISNPVRSRYGYHLIEVLGRREISASPAEQEDAARQAVGSRKSEQAYGDWLRQLYDSAYVKVMLNGQDN